MKRFLLKLYWIATALLAIDHILYWSNKISLAGNADQAFFWGWFLSTFALVIINFKKREVWISFIIFGVIFIFTFIPMIFYVGTVLPFAFKKSLCQFKINKNYTVQTENSLYLAIPRDHLIRSFGFLEKDTGIPIEVEYMGKQFELDTLAAYDIDVRDYYKELCSVKSGRVLSDSIPSRIKIELTFENGSEILTFKEQDI